MLWNRAKPRAERAPAGFTRQAAEEAGWRFGGEYEATKTRPAGGEARIRGESEADLLRMIARREGAAGASPGSTPEDGAAAIRARMTAAKASYLAEMGELRARLAELDGPGFRK